MDEKMTSSEPLPDESWNPPVIPTEHGSDVPDTVDESRIPEGKEPQVFDQQTAMNVNQTIASYIEENATKVQ